MVVPPAITPALKSEAQALKDFEGRLATWIVNRAGTSLLNINTLLANDQGVVDPLLFLPDGKTLGKEGCKLLQESLLGYAGVKSPTTEVPVYVLSS